MILKEELVKQYQNSKVWVVVTKFAKGESVVSPNLTYNDALILTGLMGGSRIMLDFESEEL